MKHGIRLSKDIGGLPEVIRADERKLKQILYNLLSNAAKFTPDNGEITLSARPLIATDGELVIRSGKKMSVPDYRRHFLEFSVTDNGIGIEPKDLKSIFKPFEQVGSKTSLKQVGTGLGLSLVKKMVELHDGRIWAESEGADKGTTVRFFIAI